MAAPTSVRIEASSITSTVLRWSYAGSSDLEIYRSTDGSAYTLITTLISSASSYEDTGLSPATKYWYKLSDDAGSTFSSVVTVWTHTCGVPPSQDSDAVLPRAGGEVTPEVFNDLAIRVETGLTRFTDPQGRTCVACISDGALVLDCITYAQCEHIEVEVTEDIRSISMPNCENDIKTIDFIIPPNTTRRICGWPGGFGFTGDECQQAPITAGSAGKTMSVPAGKGKAEKSQSKTGVPQGSSGSLGGTGSGCTCVPNGNGQLTIKSCNPNNSLNCSSTKSVRLIACGGRGPYTWSNTGSVSLSKTTGTTTTVTPPTNTGTGVAGTAYRLQGKTSNGASGCPCEGTRLQDFTCNDVGGSITTGGAGDCVNIPSAPTICTFTTSGSDCNTVPLCASATIASLLKARGETVDQRTAQMISDGCNPCGLQSGATVTVTDSLGTQTTIVLTA